jgi:hypothetical protein
LRFSSQWQTGESSAQVENPSRFFQSLLGQPFVEMLSKQVISLFPTLTNPTDLSILFWRANQLARQVQFYERSAMKKLLIFALLIAMLASGFVSTSVQAQTVSECQALIDQTRADLAGVQSIGGKDSVLTKANLDAKLADASTKLAEGKFEDAIAKLVDFRTSIENLAAAPKPKIGQEDAQLLIANANNAITCIQGLIVEG